MLKGLFLGVVLLLGCIFEKKSLSVADALPRRTSSSSSDLYLTKHVISSNKCLQLNDALQHEPRISLLKDDSYVSKQWLHPVFHMHLELYLEQGGFPVYPPIKRDLGHVYYRFSQDNVTNVMSIPKLGTHITMILFITSPLVYDPSTQGGEWFFPRQNNGTRVEPTCGTLIAFPSTFTFPHSMLPIYSNDTTIECVATWFV